MKIKNILLLTLFFPSILFAQTLRLAIQDDGKAVYYASIEKNGIFYSTNSNHIFSIPVKSNDRITIKHEIYEDFNFKLPDGLKTSDTINRVISLTSKSENVKLQIYDELTISDSKYRDIFDNENEFIIDYYPFPLNQFFVITRIKRDFYVKIINSVGDDLMTQKLGFKPTEIFLDAIGNFHLVGEDSVFQIFTTAEKIQLMKPISNDDFEIEIRNLVALNKEGAFHQKVSMHNQYYSLIRIIDQEVSDIYQSFDDEGYENAAYHYNKVVAYYMANTAEKDNIILMGIWDGDLMTLNNYDVKIVSMTSWSDKIASKPLDVSAYGLQDKIVVLDAVRDSIFQFDNETFSLIESDTKFTFTGEYFKDYFYDNIYMYSRNRKGIIISKINAEDGTTSEIAILSDIRQARNIKVINDKVYFIKLDDSQYNRIIAVNN